MRGVVSENSALQLTFGDGVRTASPAHLRYELLNGSNGLVLDGCAHEMLLRGVTVLTPMVRPQVDMHTTPLFRAWLGELLTRVTVGGLHRSPCLQEPSDISNP
ncbi:hypothetical protein GCM10009824_17090 [Kocuria atrinae]|uniref:Uncharacterized protein n=1 Tax=Kocuria atrinae TaxID=592377 RepID=A0ABP5JI77_9MICC